MSSVQTPTTPSTPMPGSSTTPLQPTYTGFVQDTREALMLFEAVLQGHLQRVTRRPHDRERANLIRSGSVFIYEEGASGIKRWTDGVSWSPSRILNNFLIYRELEKPFPPGEKKRAKPKVKAPPTPEDVGIKQEGVDGSVTSPTTPGSVSSPSVKQEGEKDSKRALVGSLTESYNFKEPDGLVKKTMSVTVSGSHFHLVSYYNPDDVERNLLQRPIDTHLKYIRVRNELVHRQNFRAPIDDTDESGQANPSWAQPAPPPQQHSYLSTGTPTHSAYMQQQQEFMQRAGQPMGGAMSPQSPSYTTHWSQQQQDPRAAYADQRYNMSAPSPVQAQNPYLSQMSQMPPSLHMRTDFPQYGGSSYAADRYQQYQDQQQSQPQMSMSPYGPSYPAHSSPMQPSPGPHGWPSR